MLNLESSRWSELEHAYGQASDIPPLLRQLHGLPPSAGESEPWFTLWSALAHQGDVYPASFAAVPHVIAALATAPSKADASFFHFPAWVEICRAKHGTVIPVDLAGDYFASLKRLPALVAEAASERNDPGFAACALAAVAAALGQHAMAEVILEMASPGLALDVLGWLDGR
ncbi:MAG: hypothetical protein A2W72_04505 [Burkholderiales bacterium RIFCSPLOWO2_12_67_14]|nr:MAG: hypothetical protein A3I64_15750 [Burkholderiales bacterium RIFCSPLOWO2_02_FULL_67_64]OGB44137.1 MAG: hypothetical protein A3E51_09175 [Burkholderiales bacterium RIFCSPHIGHO2_12_FULL_67_38]OGB45802.1 MAG: hypothetical protein A2W72_04505 [Burkholderiales bacterium RIFCSPLOWO2_12_67_14]OGC00929.1 MAG: hypothetical protein A3G82_11415 [Burkholderiales bacterium RIFCSPLOWO2_12_FULL_67_210]